MLTDYLSERYSFERFTKKKRPPILNSLHAVGLRAAFSKKNIRKICFYNRLTMNVILYLRTTKYKDCPSVVICFQINKNDL
jgi:hypothetical protein